MLLKAEEVAGEAVLCQVLKADSRWVLAEGAEVVRRDWMLGRHCGLLVRLELFLVLFHSLVVLAGEVTARWG